MASHSRASISTKEKIEICTFATNHPSKSQQDIANHFSNAWKKAVKRRTVGDILKGKEKWAAEVNQSSKRCRIGQHEPLEKALYLWFMSARAKNLTITQVVLRRKAMEFGAQLNIADFQYSFGWINRFQKRYGISSRVVNVESDGVYKTVLQEGLRKTRETIAKFFPRDVFNMDETGLYYQMLPDRSLTTNVFVKGTKRSKERISLALCANADGTEKSKLLILGKSKKPRCFRNFRVDLYADYKSNKKGWMTDLLFSDWVQAFDRKMRLQGRQVLLLLDYAPFHIPPLNDDGSSSLTNVEVHFLPPATTSHLQPMDAGVIQAFKSHYRRQQIQHLIDAIDNDETPKLDLSYAIRYAKIAWDSVTPEVIRNCYRHTGILPTDWSASTLTKTEANDDSPTFAEPSRNMFERLAAALEINTNDLMTKEEFVDIDANIECSVELEDKDILEIVQENEENEEGERLELDDDHSSAAEMKTLTPPTSVEARVAINTLLRYFESNTLADEHDVSLVSALRSRIDTIASQYVKQE